MKEYKDTLNLPKTSFPMRGNLPVREVEFLKGWEKEGLYSEIRGKNKHSQKYILHDGPPYANGNIHIGHALNKILKDIIIRHKTMEGYDALYVPGWDCHGLPIEHALFKQLGITKDDIDRVVFRKKARRYAEKYIEIQKKDFIRLGIFGNWDKPYLTMNYSYQASIMDAFVKLYRKGYIYKGEKPIHWCPQCETALAEAELEYAEKVSDSIFVRFAVDIQRSKESHAYESLKRYCEDGGNLYIMIWTTTPWTIPANVAVAVHPELKYVVLEDKKSRSFYICSKNLLAGVVESIGLEGYTVCEEIKGDKLENLYYRHPFMRRFSPVKLADYVSDEDGCGAVHIAPGHGEEDYLVGIKYGLPIISPVDEKGRFTSEFPEGEGLKVMEANDVVIKLLRDKGALLSSSKFEHSYPHCWRCKSPVIFRATAQWFLSVEHKGLRKRMLDMIDNKDDTNWIPEWGKNRIKGMISSRPDWCLSRQRYWGVPIPVLYCDSCGHERLPDNFDLLIEKVRKDGADIWFTIEPNEILSENAKCRKCGNSVFRRETDIVDVWFDSGVSHKAVLEEYAGLGYPADLYLEGSDQHRGWFQTSLITSVALKNMPPFRNVVTHGFTVDGNGKKMSKSKGNVIAPQDIIKKYGADVLRLWVSSCDISNDVRISDEIVKQMGDAYRKIRNTIRYLLGNLFDFDFKIDAVGYENLESIDKWALSKLILLVKNVGAAYGNFRFHNIYREVYNFCVVEMSSFYLDILKDRMYTARTDSKVRRSHQTAMYHIALNLIKILAPILPFTADEAWKSFRFVDEAESVHLAAWPDISFFAESRDDAELWDKITEIRDIVNPYIEEKRKNSDIGSSLEAAVILYSEDDETRRFLKENAENLKLALIVSQVYVREEPCLLRPDEAAIDFDIMLKVVNADGSKCARCWKYSPEVGKYAEYPDICPECAEAVRE